MLRSARWSAAQPRPGPERWVRMANPEQRRARARVCEAKAEAARDPEVRLRYRDIAGQWRQMGRQHEEIESDRLMLTRAWSATGGN